MRNQISFSGFFGGTLAVAALLCCASSSLRAAVYSDAVLSDAPLAYYRFNEAIVRTNINANSGSLGSTGNATNLNVHLIPGAVKGSGNAAAYFDSAARTIVPWTPALNPNETNSFTIEAWFYPTSDKVAGAFTGPAPLMNRYSYSGVDRQGWVYFQRNPDDSYASDGQSAVGWNFRTYRASGSNTGIDVTSQVPYKLGQWQHVVTVWDGSSQTATMYVDGAAAATNTWAGDGAGYVANTDHPATDAPNGPAGLSIGSYNNTETGSNPFRGAIDEVAFYSKTLTAAQIQAHYQNATNAARTVAYDALVKSDGPVGYWRLDDPVSGVDLAVNMGTLQSGGAGQNTAEVQHGAAGAVEGTADPAYGYHWRNGSATTDIPWAVENNPDTTAPFTVEAWFRPTSDRINPGAAPIANRLASSAANRTGWIFFQRAPNDTYSGVSGFEGVGWNFRMYTGSGTGGNDVTSSLPYTVGQWQHVVATWDGNGTATMFVNGLAAATNSAVTYVANSNPPQSPDDALTPADLAIGSYNAASGLGSNPFEGEVDEVAIYTNILSPEQVLAHYTTGTNSHPATNYATLVLSAPYDGAGTQGLQPVTYLRLNEPAPFTAGNSGTIGTPAAGSLVVAENNAAGPVTAGFESSNAAVALDGAKGWVSLGQPPGLNISGQITLEAWVKPGATQGDNADIISHGPPTLSSYDSSMVETNGSVTVGSQVLLGLQNQGADYAVGASDGTNFHGVHVAVTAGDLGTINWIHLVGTYDGTTWKLFRNGAQIASATDPVGALAVDNGDWAIGSAGDGWADNFAGGVDEVAIYGKALSAAQIQAHYAAASATVEPGPGLSISSAAGKVTISWTTGKLQQADVVTGPFTEVANAASPYSVTPAGTSKFYRTQQ